MHILAGTGPLPESVPYSRWDEFNRDLKYVEFGDAWAFDVFVVCVVVFFVMHVYVAVGLLFALLCLLFAVFLFFFGLLFCFVLVCVFRVLCLCVSCVLCVILFLFSMCFVLSSFRLLGLCCRRILRLLIVCAF